MHGKEKWENMGTDQANYSNMLLTSAYNIFYNFKNGASNTLCAS